MIPISTYFNTFEKKLKRYLYFTKSMNIMELWDQNTEVDFFASALKLTSPEQLFYKTNTGKYVAYWVKGYDGAKSTLQSRNSLIGNYTEKYSRDLMNFVLQNYPDEKLYAIQGGICDEIGLSNLSPGDVVIARKNQINLQPRDIALIVEVKMSVVWNWEYDKNKNFVCLGDFNSHSGNPGMLRSDSMLKGIGKSINIRVSSFESSTIPIIILGNTPITRSYYPKVDHLKKSGIIQGFWSVNSHPLDNPLMVDNKYTPQKGFIRMDSIQELQDSLFVLLRSKLNFFSSMKDKTELGQIIEIANRETQYEKKAEVFLNLIRA